MTSPRVQKVVFISWASAKIALYDVDSSVLIEFRFMSSNNFD